MVGVDTVGRVARPMGQMTLDDIGSLNINEHIDDFACDCALETNAMAIRGCEGHYSCALCEAFGSTPNSSKERRQICEAQASNKEGNICLQYRSTGIRQAENGKMMVLHEQKLRRNNFDSKCIPFHGGLMGAVVLVQEPPGK